jgi:hypothetical protein
MVLAVQQIAVGEAFVLADKDFSAVIEILRSRRLSGRGDDLTPGSAR